MQPLAAVKIPIGYIFLNLFYQQNNEAKSAEISLLTDLARIHLQTAYLALISVSDTDGS